MRLLAFQALLSALLAPPWLGPWWGIVIGLSYLVMSWFLGGLYLSDMIHLGIAHRALDYREWFIKAVTLINNTVGVYVNPVSWVNRHRIGRTTPSSRPGPSVWSLIPWISNRMMVIG